MSDEDETGGDGGRRFGARDLWKVGLGIVGLVAVVQELRTPAEDRTWHGTVAGFVPYDFRPPTAQRAKDTWWNPEGPVVSSKLFGVGWTANLGAIVSRVRSAAG